MELNECINYMLTRAQNAVFNHFKSRLAPYGITPAQYALLKCLWDQGDQSPTQISCALCLDSSTITGIIARMEDKDLVERVHSNVDRRAVDIRIRPAGVALQEDIERVIREANEETLADLDPAIFNAFKQTLESIVQNVKKCEKCAA